MKHIPLGDIATVERNSIGPESIVDGTLYVGLEHITGEGTFENVAPVSNGDLSSGKFQFDESHVLYGKLRPYLKKTALPTFSGICSTDILPIKPGPALDRRYLFYYLRQQSVVDFATSQCTGINLPRLSPQRLNEFEIPLPPLAEQKRIAAILDQADALRVKRRAALARLDRLVQAVFLEMFGDPVTNPMGWARVSVEELCKTIVDCPHTTPVYTENQTDYPCIRTSDLQNGFLDFTTTKYVDKEQYELRIQRHKPIAGDILYSREGERFGIASMVPGGLTPCLGQRMMLLQADSKVARPAFLWALMNNQFIYQQAVKLVGGSTSPHVNVRDIKSYNAFAPCIDLQEKFQTIIERIIVLREVHYVEQKTTERLFGSLQQRAFRGEL